MVSKEMLMEEAKELRKQWSAFFINNWQLTLLILIALVVGGVLSLVSIPKESDPEVVIPIAAVSVSYPGASPSDVEQLITDRMEERFKGLSNVKNISSVSREGLASITVEFEANADLDKSIRELRDEADNAKSILPEDANDPVVTEIRMEDQPIVTYSLLGNVPPDQLKEYGEDLQSRIESISGVSQVPMYGIEREEVQVYVRVEALEGYGLSIGQVVNAIRQNHSDIPVGSLESDDFLYQVTLKGQFHEAEDLLDLPVTTVNGEPVYLRDIAEVRQAFAKRTSESSVYLPETGEDKRSVTLQLYKRSGGNILSIVDKANETVDEFREELPPGMDVFVTNDFSVFIRDDVKTLGRSGLQTIIIIFIVLLVALGFREAFLTGFTLPLIFMISFFGLYAYGETINSLVLFALILSLGLIVDTSIVIMEGFHHFLKERGLPPSEAALQSVKTFKAPLISSTLTTVSAFVPMMLMTGIVGQYVKHIPITVIIALAASLFVAILLLPAIAVRAFKKYDPNKKQKPPLLSHVIKPLRAWHESFLRTLLPSRKRRWLWTGAMLLIFGIAMSLPMTGVIKTELFGKTDLDFFYVNISGPTGSSLEETRVAAEKVEESVRNLPGLKNYVLVVGGQTSIDMGGFGTSNGSNLASFTVNLVPREDRDYESYEISERLRQEVKEITEVEVEIQDLGAGPPTGAPIALRVIGEDSVSIEKVAHEIEQHLATIDGVLEPDTNIETGTGEFRFTVKRDALSYYGLTAGQVASELRTAVFGNDSVKIIKNGEETPIVIGIDFRDEECLNDPLVKLQETRDHVTICGSRPESISEINQLLIATPKGAVPVAELADVELEQTVRSIRHEDGEQIVTIEAYNREDRTAVEIVEELQEFTDNMELPAGVRVSYGGDLEEIAESFQSLWNALFVGLILIAFFLVLQFHSFKQPFIIIFALPLALIGVFFGLALLGRNFSFPGFIGIVALLGIVVNDSIVLVDRINANVKTGMEKLEAVVTATGERLQPIILTTVTTAAGVFPLAYAGGLWGDLAWTIMFGIVFATALSLVTVPVFYIMLETKRKKRKKKEFATTA